MGPGTHIDRGDARIVVEKRIGSGAMGNVFSGWIFHAPQGPRAGDAPELVALKQLRREVRQNKEIRTLFQNEGQALSLLHHPNVVRFLDLFEWIPPPARAKTAPVPIAPPPASIKKTDGALTLVMELVVGDSLDSVIARNVARARLANGRGCLLPARAFQYFEQLVGGLSAAHARGIIHRDREALQHDGAPRRAREADRFWNRLFQAACGSRGRKRFTRAGNGRVHVPGASDGHAARWTK